MNPTTLLAALVLNAHPSPSPDPLFPTDAPTTLSFPARPQIALPGSEHTPAAVVARLARSAIESAGARADAARAPEATLATSWARSFDGVQMERAMEATLAGLGVAGLIAAWVVAHRAHARRRRMRADARGVSGLYWAARNLATAGTPLSEASRRTGVPQDVIGALLWLDRRTTEPPAGTT